MNNINDQINIMKEWIDLVNHSIKRGSYCDDKAQERRSDPNAQFSRYDFWRTHTHVMVHCGVGVGGLLAVLIVGCGVIRD